MHFDATHAKSIHPIHPSKPFLQLVEPHQPYPVDVTRTGWSCGNAVENKI